MKFIRRALFYDTNLFNNHFRQYMPSHVHNTRSFNNLNVPYFRSETFRNFTVYRCIDTFNNLPAFLKENTSHFNFKKMYKEYCFSSYDS